jgi:hypothetical protein
MSAPALGSEYPVILGTTYLSLLYGRVYCDEKYWKFMITERFLLIILYGIDTKVIDSIFPGLFHLLLCLLHFSPINQVLERFGLISLISYERRSFL